MAVQNWLQLSMPWVEPHSNTRVQDSNVHESASHIRATHEKPSAHVGALFRVHSLPQLSVPAVEPHSSSAVQLVTSQEGGPPHVYSATEERD